ncbi:PhzF family phenazine biosynthesis protein [Cerasicoccus frondis]|uniref:PhzF family phenazine biosynthesis protein n=1 Tax=Cerasicoccus frondis TaxID=490090 RepID=UPI002852AACA|nr:PhzF family phenazine biosynthesis protein [Cerasicoccus frondis]
MSIPLYQVDAFADAPFQGNPAAVCPLESWPDNAVLQAIAAENNLSETAFYAPEGDGFRLRWFTPVDEVDLCGHATLATAFVLFRQRPELISGVTFYSNSGPLHVTAQGEEITLDFPATPTKAWYPPHELVDSIGVTPIECRQGMDYLAVLPDEATVRGVEPVFDLLRQLDLRGVIITAPGDEVDFVSRFFAPKYGINEDPVTGSAHCALTPYWAEKLGKTELLAKQLSTRSGRLSCSLRGERVFISGRGRLYLEGKIHL